MEWVGSLETAASADQIDPLGKVALLLLCFSSAGFLFDRLVQHGLLFFKCLLRTHMRIRRIVLFMLAGICLIQLVRLYVENRYLQQIMAGQKPRKVRRVLGGHSPDASGQYLVHRFYKSEGFGLKDINPKDVTLVSHCTVERLHHIIGLVETWGGPMSISIFAPGNDAAFADDAIDGLRLCWPALRTTTSLHIVYPRGSRTEANMTGVGDFAYLSCKDIMRRLMLRKQSDNVLYPKYPDSEVDEAVRYPHNLMRNVGLSGSLTDYVLTVDIEMVPSVDMRRLFLEFAEREKIFKRTNDEKSNSISDKFNTVYIIPAFEVKEDEDIGRTKSEILDATKKGICRPLLEETCPVCHKATKYDKWTNGPAYTGQRFGVAYDVSFATNWEPYFIARREAPWYDENMKDYGHDRLAQVCELRVQNFKFSVLNDAFLTKRSFHTKSQMRAAELQRKDDKTKFRQNFYIRLRESGRIHRQHVELC